MKTLIALLAFTCSSMAAFGQWSIGPKVSYGTITQAAEQIRIIPTSDEIPPQLAYTGGNSVKSVGFMLYNNIGPGFLQIETLGTQYDLEFSSKENSRSTAEPTLHRETHTIIEVPVAAGFNFNNFKVGGGPVLEMQVGKDSELSSLDRYVDTSNKFDGGFQALAGYTFKNVDVDFRYIYRFTGIVDGFSIGNDILKLNKSANRFTVSLGYRIGMSKVKEELPVEGEEVLPMVY